MGIQQPKRSYDVNALALIKGGERFVFLYDDKAHSELLRELGKMAMRTDLTFSWYDAAVLSQKIRHQHAELNKPNVPKRFHL